MWLLGRALPLAVEGREIKASRDLSPCTQAPQVLLSVAEWGPPRVCSHLHPEGVAQLFAAARRKAPGEQRGTVADELERGRGGEHGRGEGSARPDCVCRSRGSPTPRPAPRRSPLHTPAPPRPGCGQLRTLSGPGRGPPGSWRQAGPPTPRAAAVPGQKGTEEP